MKRVTSHSLLMLLSLGLFSEQAYAGGQKLISAHGGLCQAGCNGNPMSDSGSTCSTELSPDLGLDGEGLYILKDTFYVSIDDNPEGGIVSYTVTPHFAPEGSDKPVVAHTKVRCTANNGDAQKTIKFSVHAIEVTK